MVNMGWGGVESVTGWHRDMVGSKRDGWGREGERRGGDDGGISWSGRGREDKRSAVGMLEYK